MLRRKNDYRLAVRIQHRSLERSPQVEMIMAQAKHEVDVRYIGAVDKRAVLWHQKRHRPLQIGTSIAHFNVTAGTLGCFVRDRETGSLHILSNNHVLANENKGKSGDAILQPGRIDGGIERNDTVGQLARFVRLKRRGINVVDCAIATISTGTRIRRKALHEVGELAGLGDEFLEDGTAVEKIGRTTGHTRGRITAFELDDLITGFDTGNLRFNNQIEIEGEGDAPFSQGGDSGSLIFDADRRGVALLFAGSDQGGANGQGLTYANPLHTVLENLGVDLAV
jgi:hypothetical protein